MSISKTSAQVTNQKQLKCKFTEHTYSGQSKTGLRYVTDDSHELT